MSLYLAIKEKRKSSKVGSDSVPSSLWGTTSLLADDFWNTPTRKQTTFSPSEQAFLTSLASYVPGIVVRQFRTTGHALELPHTQTWHSCILFADISGFTPLTESLASQGKRGIELLTEHLNNYFGKMIELIVGHGGDVVKFAGDALLSIFPAQDEEKLGTIALLATQCALQLQKQLGKYEANGVCLTLHIGVSSGLVTGVHVGGVQNKVEFILAGPPLDDVGDCEKAADSGEVYISHAIATLIAPHAELSTKVAPHRILATSCRHTSTHVGRFIADRAARNQKLRGIQRVKNIQETPLEHYRLDKLLVKVNPPSITPHGTIFFENMEKYLSPYAQGGWYPMKRWDLRGFEMRRASFADTVEDETRVSIPDFETCHRPTFTNLLVVLEHIKSGAPDSFLTQLRTVSVIFVMLDLAYSPKTIPKIQDAMQAMQTAVYHYDGTVRQFIIDDKGSVFIAVWGLPPRCHEDDPSRATQSCMMLQKSLAGLEIGTSIGITTGDVFSGAVGCSSRREYAVVGDLVNLSARLMVAAKGLILADARTQESCPELSFKDLGEITVKGKSVPIQIFTPLKKTTTRLQKTDSLGDSEKKMIGREIELKRTS